MLCLKGLLDQELVLSFIHQHNDQNQDFAVPRCFWIRLIDQGFFLISFFIVCVTLFSLLAVVDEVDQKLKKEPFMMWPSLSSLLGGPKDT